MTTLGIADMIADDAVTLAELSKVADVEPQFLSAQKYRLILPGFRN